MENEEHDKRLDNLKPFQKGKSGNPKGRPKGIKNLSTVIQQILADEELVDKIVKAKPSYWNDLPSKNGANAIMAAMMINAMAGDHRAAAWIAKYGFGDKLVHEFEDGLFQTAKIEVEIVPTKNKTERDTES